MYILDENYPGVTLHWFCGGWSHIVVLFEEIANISITLYKKKDSVQIKNIMLRFIRHESLRL